MKARTKDDSGPLSTKQSNKEKRTSKIVKKALRYTGIKQKLPSKCPLLMNFHLGNGPYSNSPKGNNFNVRLKNPSLHFSVH